MSNKPIKPNVELPDSFGGTKSPFDSSKITNGYEPDVPDILGGANLNYLLDTLGKKEKYYDTIVDFINNIPVAKTITVDVNDNLVYRDWLGGRNYGELVYSAIPLSDSSLKLLDGSLLSYSGIYKNFIDYIESIVSTYPSIFTTESNWQSTVSQYGVCGKFVYNSTNKTVRLPKVTGIIEGTVDVNALGNIVAAGLPTLTTVTSGNHTHSGTTGNGSAHSHSKGSFRITGTIESTDTREALVYADGLTASGALYLGNKTTNFPAFLTSGTGTVHQAINIDTNRANSWTGSTSTESSHTHSYNITSSGSHNHTINWGVTTNTVQPQTVKMFVYIVVSTSILKTDDVIDIDDLTSMIDGKADSDGSNMVGSLSSSAQAFFTGLALPSTTKINISIPISGNTITIPADGYICCSNDITLTNTTRYLYGNCFPVVLDDVITVTYDTTDENSEIFFVYAQGGI